MKREFWFVLILAFVGVILVIYGLYFYQTKEITLFGAFIIFLTFIAEFWSHRYYRSKWLQKVEKDKEE